MESIDDKLVVRRSVLFCSTNWFSDWISDFKGRAFETDRLVSFQKIADCYHIEA
jgi:hypothetical protein